MIGGPAHPRRGEHAPVHPPHSAAAPAGPTRIGRLVCHARMLLDPLRRPERLFARYGDLVQLNDRLCVVRSPELVEPLLRDYFAFGKEFSRTYQDAARLFWGNSILLSNGEDWLRQRRILQNALGHQSLGAYAHTMVSYTRTAVDTWPQHKPFDLHARLMQLCLSIMTRNLLGADPSVADMAVVVAALDATMALFGDPVELEFEDETPLKRRFRESVLRLNEVIHSAIAQRRADPTDRGDMLSALMSRTDTDAPMTDIELRDEIVTILRAAHRNTATLVAWAIALIATHSHARSALSSEIDEILGGTPLSLRSLPRLLSAEKVIKETMRLYPLYPSIRRDLDEGGELGGYRLPAGTVLSIDVWAMHRDPRYFAQPERFDPERWTDAFERSLPKLAFLPFGGGPRQCPFKSYGMVEAIVLLTTIVQRHDIALAPGERAIPQDTANGLLPKGGLQVILSPRPARS
jgi:cytochrome P450